MIDFSKVSGKTLLVVGDVMLDEFCYGQVGRISPEAAVPVVTVNRTVRNAGGAANVAMNAAALKVHCKLVSVCGADADGQALQDMLDAAMVDAILALDTSRQTTKKTRFVSEHYKSHLLRADLESPHPLSAERQDFVISHVLRLMPLVNAVVISDYCKGVLRPRVLRAIIDSANEHGKPVVVDPKARDCSIYSGATVITPNLQELANAVNYPVSVEDGIDMACNLLMDQAACKNVLVTCGERGVVLYGDKETVHIEGKKVRVADVSGAGDTVTATMGAMLAAGFGVEDAAVAANQAAAIAVSRPGVTAVTLGELQAALTPRIATSGTKIVTDPDEAHRIVGSWIPQVGKIGFTNGCFDLIHPGHIKLLTEARSRCDRLIVAINSDDSVRRLKGNSRPIQSEMARAGVLAALEPVDMVVIFNDDDPLGLLRWLTPDILFKGADYTLDGVVGSDFVESYGGEVVLIDVAKDFSTTRLVEKIRL